MNPNKKVLVIVAAVLILGGVFFVSTGKFQSSSQSAQAALYYCPMHPTYTSNRPGTCPICNMNLVPRGEEDSMEEAMPDHQSHSQVSGPEVYACPMHPEVASDKPGVCPKCNMDLEKKEAAADSIQNQNPPREFTVQELLKMKPGEICLLHKCKMKQCMIAMNEEFARLGKCPHCNEDLGVTIKNAPPEGYAKLKMGSSKQELLGVETAPAKKIELSKTLRTVGRIAYDPELYQAQEEYLQALRASEKASASLAPEINEQAAKLVDSTEIRLRLLGLNEELMKEIKEAGKPDRSLLYSDPGGRVWLYAPVYEYELSWVKKGDRIQVEMPGQGGQKFEGVIRSIDSVLDPMTRSARVRAVLENPEGLLKPEMYVNASLSMATGEKLAVPKEAVFATGEKNIVFVKNPDGSLEPREVVLGVMTDDFSEIRSGIGEGEAVVTSGNFLIDSESRLKAALQGMSNQGGGHTGHGA